MIYWPILDGIFTRPSPENVYNQFYLEDDLYVFLTMIRKGEK